MTPQELIAKHELINDNLSDFFGSLSQEQFTKNIGEGWSPAEHLAHLIVGYKVVGKALAAPKTVLAIRFGKQSKNTQTESYESIVATYQAALKSGLKAPQEFVPKQDKVILDKVQAVQNLHEISKRFADSLNKWDDTTLDSYVLPHPAYSKKLSIRELMYFELYHSLHHRNNIAKDLNLPEAWPI